MRSTARPPADPLTRWDRALVAWGVTLWERSWEVGLRYAGLIRDPAGPAPRPARPLPDLGVAYRQYAAEIALVPWLAAERFRDELTGARPARPERSVTVGGRPLPLPVRVRAAMQGFALYAVPARAARQILAERGAPFVPVPLGLDRAAAALTAVRYTASDLGVHDEVGLALLVAPRGDPWAPGLYFVDLPVNGHFSCHAGRAVWGLAKTEAPIEVHVERTAVSWTLGRARGAEPILTVAFFRGGGGGSTATPLRIYTVRRGVPHCTALVRTGRGERIRVGGGGVTLHLGAPGAGATPGIGRAVQQLGLARAPLMLHAWTERMSGDMHAPTPLT